MLLKIRIVSLPLKKKEKQKEKVKGIKEKARRRNLISPKQLTKKAKRHQTKMPSPSTSGRSIPNKSK